MTDLGAPDGDDGSVLVLAVVLLVALGVGGAAAAATARWPRLDPAAPRPGAARLRRSLARHPRAAAALRRRLDARTATGLALTAATAVVVVATVAVGALLVMVRTETGLHRADEALAEWAADSMSGGEVTVVRAVTRLGGAELVVPVVAAVGAVAAWRHRRWAVLAFPAVTLGAQFAVVYTTKWLVDRARPDLDPLSGFTGASFPSGHAAAAATAWACIALLVAAGRRRRVHVVAAGTAAGVAGAVATTRVLLGVHWLTDVVAGLVLGWACFALGVVAFGGAALRFGEPADAAAGAAATPPGPPRRAGAAGSRPRRRSRGGSGRGGRGR